MSIVEEIRVGTIETTEIDESQFDESANVHLWNGHLSYCGATEIGHKSDCPFVTKAWAPYPRTTETACPGCGVPVCTFCIFLHESGKANA